MTMHSTAFIILIEKALCSHSASDSLFLSVILSQQEKEKAERHTLVLNPGEHNTATWFN